MSPSARLRTSIIWLGWIRHSNAAACTAVWMSIAAQAMPSTGNRITPPFRKTRAAARAADRASGFARALQPHAARRRTALRRAGPPGPRPPLGCHFAAKPPPSAPRAARADQYRAPRDAGDALDRVRHCGPFLRERAAESRAGVDAPRGAVQRHRHHAQPVHRGDLVRDLLRRAGHAGKAQVAAKQALIGESRERLASLRRCAAFFRLDHLVQALL